MQRPAVVNMGLKPIIIGGVVVRDKEFLHRLGKVLELNWLHGKNHQIKQDYVKTFRIFASKPEVQFTKRALIENTLPSLACGAVENNDFICLQALLEEVDVNFGNYDGIRPLHTACELGNLDMVKFLLGKGASPQLVNRFGQCPLHLAIKNRRYIVIKLLCMKGFTVKLQPVRIAMEMIKAVQNRDYPLLHAWALSGVDMDAKDYNGRTVMHEAVRLRDNAMISKLLEYGATPLERDVWGHTAVDDAQNESLIMRQFDPIFTVCYPTKQAYLLHKEKHS